MPRHQETRHLPFSPAQMFDLVADVGSYPQFLPWVAAVRIRQKTDRDMLADMIVGFSGLREQFTSRVLMDRPGMITVDYIDGPMRDLHNEWRFRDALSGGCYVDFTVDFTFRSAVFEAMAGQMFQKALRRMTEAFEQRAFALYAVSELPGVSNPSA